MSHTVGYVGDINQDEMTVLYNQGYKKTSIVGKTGIEKQYDSLLQGKEGREMSTVDVHGRIISDTPIVEPPEMVNENSDAARVMDTIVSGILYDKFSPSAIINIEGSDYLVKKGDVVNNYKVLCIAQDSVTVQLGENTYKAGIGEILTEGTLNHNDVSNLDNKFGGAR